MICSTSFSTANAENNYVERVQQSRKLKHNCLVTLEICMVEQKQIVTTGPKYSSVGFLSDILCGEVFVYIKQFSISSY